MILCSPVWLWTWGPPASMLDPCLNNLSSVKEPDYDSLILLNRLLTTQILPYLPTLKMAMPLQAWFFLGRSCGLNPRSAAHQAVWISEFQINLFKQEAREVFFTYRVKNMYCDVHLWIALCCFHSRVSVFKLCPWGGLGGSKLWSQRLEASQGYSEFQASLLQSPNKQKKALPPTASR